MALQNYFANRVINSVSRNCQIHGDYESKLVVFGSRQTWSICPGCNQDDIDAQTRADDASLRAERNASIVQIAAIPPRFENRNLENYKAENDGQKRALKIAQEYADDCESVIKTGRSLIFCGNTGTGKTHLAIGIAKIFMAKGKTAGFIRIMDAIRKVRETYRRDSPITERQAIAQFALADLMIFDEIGLQRGNDEEKIMMYELLNARYDGLRPTIILSNLEMDGVKEYLGVRPFDRMRENGGKALAFNWASYRGVA